MNFWLIKFLGPCKMSEGSYCPGIFCTHFEHIYTVRLFMYIVGIYQYLLEPKTYFYKGMCKFVLRSVIKIEFNTTIIKIVMIK